MGTEQFTWPGTHVVITGGSSGIGEALAVALAAKGSRLTLLARGADRLSAVAKPLGATGDLTGQLGMPRLITIQSTYRW